MGLLLLAFPRMDQPWLDAIESIAPPVQTTFLTEFERTTRDEMIASIERGKAELTRLRELEQDVRWGKAEMDAEKVERLRQYLAGRGEIDAGEQLVLRHLRDKARDRQRCSSDCRCSSSVPVGFTYSRRSLDLTPADQQLIA